MTSENNYMTQEVSKRNQSDYPRRMYSKQELTQMYFPNGDVSPDNARHTFVKMITRCQPLMSRLSELGYDKHCHYFTPLMVDAIFYYMGEPDALPVLKRHTPL